MKHHSRKLGIAICFALPVATAATEPPTLAHNPFSRPPSAATFDDADVALEFDGTGPALKLLATMIGSNNRLANVAGRVLRPGDEVQGHSLLQVFEDRAVFLREGRRLTIYVKPELEEDDE